MWRLDAPPLQFLLISGLGVTGRSAFWVVLFVVMARATRAKRRWIGREWSKKAAPAPTTQKLDFAN